MNAIAPRLAPKTEPECLHDLFEAQVSVRPSNLAVLSGEQRLSYQELDHRANQLARYLRLHGVRSNTLVGVYFERSEKPIVAILAILKAGAGYLPFDPAYPSDRIDYIMQEANVSVLLTEQKISSRVSSFFDGTTILLDNDWSDIARQAKDRLSSEESEVSGKDLCYVLYTSGTTGRPKGVMTEHCNVVQFVDSFNEICEIESTDRLYHGFSLSFDGSVEEMWMAFSNGATLIIGPPDISRLGNEVADFLTQHKVTFFSTVSTFLGMIPEDLPTVRLLIVSGEPCPPELVKRWALPGRRMLNVYGPTETTVNTTATECIPNKPITIGQPLRGYQTFILDSEMQPIQAGEPGELYIGGVGVARGYLNQPELTGQQFVSNPFDQDQLSKLYRTGDLVRLKDDNDLEFLGRIDRQVKIRGYRIELSEIESVLRERTMVHSAVVNVFEHDGLKELAAYIVPVSSQTAFDRDDVLKLLRTRVPPYMVPGYLDLLDELPTLASGKVNRQYLPEPKAPLVHSERKIVAPCNSLEYRVTEVWESIFKISPISTDDDFFLDLGGYSLLAAQMVTQLRSEHDLEVSIRDVYSYPTVQHLAENLATRENNRAPEADQAHKQSKSQSSREVFESLSGFARKCVIGLQTFALYLLYGIGTAPLLILVWMFQNELPVSAWLWAAAGFMLLGFPLLLVLSIAFKWLIIGRYKPGRYPVWGFYYLRWWLVTRMQAMSGSALLSGTPLMSLYYRAMGAKIGKNCILDTSHCAVFDLLTLGDDTSIGSETQLLGYRVENGMLNIETTEIGSRCFIGIHCALGLNTKMGDDACLGDLSLLQDDAVMPQGESRRGSPAQTADVILSEVEDSQPVNRRPFLFGTLHFLAIGALQLILFLAILPIILINLAVFSFGGVSWGIGSVFLSIPLTVISFCLTVAAIKALILPSTKPGVYPVESWFFVKKWLVDALFTMSRHIVHPLYTTIYLPPWLRMLGAKIGRRAEISTVTQMTPDLTVIGDESFFADGSMVGGRRFYRDSVQFQQNRIGRRSFVGNSALLPVGVNLGNNCLLGCLSVPPTAANGITEGSEWLGSPSFRLPHRQKVEGFDASETYNPTHKLYTQRYLIDALRIFLPNFIGVAGTVGYFLGMGIALAYLPLWAILILAPIAGIGLAVGTALGGVIVKKALMGRFQPAIKPLWSVYVWLNEAVNGVYETIAAPALTPMMGTPFFCIFLRLMGCKVGKHAFIETTRFSEFDLVDIGDYAALNRDVIVQNHLFEDRIMKSSYLKIGDKCSVGNMSVVLYDTEMKQGSCIGPLSLLMKGETLPPFSRWVGIPTGLVAEADRGSPD